MGVAESQLDSEVSVIIDLEHYVLALCAYVESIFECGHAYLLDGPVRNLRVAGLHLHVAV